MEQEYKINGYSIEEYCERIAKEKFTEGMWVGGCVTFALMLGLYFGLVVTGLI